MIWPFMLAEIADGVAVCLGLSEVKRINFRSIFEKSDYRISSKRRSRGFLHGRQRGLLHRRPRDFFHRITRNILHGRPTDLVHRRAIGSHKRRKEEQEVFSIEE